MSPSQAQVPAPVSHVSLPTTPPQNIKKSSKNTTNIGVEVGSDSTRASSSPVGIKGPVHPVSRIKTVVAPSGDKLSHSHTYPVAIPLVSYRMHITQYCLTVGLHPPGRPIFSPHHTNIVSYQNNTQALENPTLSQPRP